MSSAACKPKTAHAADEMLDHHCARMSLPDFARHARAVGPVNPQPGPMLYAVGVDTLNEMPIHNIILARLLPLASYSHTSSASYEDAQAPFE